MLNYEEIFIAIIEYIRDNPRCDREDCLNYIYEKFNIKKNEDQYFISTTIEKVAIQSQLQITAEFHTRYTALVIHPDALFYLMEYRELIHSLKESKEAKRWAIASMVISILAFGASVYFSMEQIKISERPVPTPNELIIKTNDRLDSLLKDQKKQNEILTEHFKNTKAKK